MPSDKFALNNDSLEVKTLEMRKTGLKEKVNEMTTTLFTLRKNLEKVAPNLDEQSILKTEEVLKKLDTFINTSLLELPFDSQGLRLK
ncbi:MAG: hypothetical protein WC671_01725 [Candidatus Paceibacterota bacterium]|jgi:hypothetical protein